MLDTDFQELKIEITRQCNLNCYFCFDKMDNTRYTRDFLPSKDVFRIIDKAAAYGIERVRITGGEPCLREEVASYLQHAKEKGMITLLNTNATLLTPEKTGKIARYLDDVLISLHSLNVAVNPELKESPVVRKKIEAIHAFKRRNVFVRVATILQPENIPFLRAGYSFIESLPVDQWVLLRPIPNLDCPFPLTEAQVKELVETLFALKKEKKMPHLIENAMPFCSYEPGKVASVSHGGYNEDGRTGLVVDYKGNLRPNYFFPLNFGNALETDWEEVWNNEWMHNLRSGKFLPGVCKTCTYQNTCKGGSRFAAEYVHKSIQALDPLARPDKYIKENNRQLITRKV